jgi:alcohol dehydrogenase class IV
LERRGLEVSIEQIHGEPSPEAVDHLVESFRAHRTEAVVSVGGGSVLDASTAAGALLFEEGSVEDFLEGVGTRMPSGKTLPVIAVPTTAGTGSEATKNAVISRPGREGFKKSLRHDNFVPVAALLDPDLTVSCPREITVASGLDAFSQLLESFLCTGAHPVTDALAWDGLTRFLRSFPRLIEEPDRVDLRLEVALGAYYSGITLANAGLGTVHAMAGVMGGLRPVPHGAACGTLLYETFRATVAGWKTRGEDPEECAAWVKMGRLGGFLDGRILSAEKGAERLLDELEDWQNRYQPPRLSAMGFTREDIPLIVQGGNKSHPCLFTEAERTAILESRF